MFYIGELSIRGVEHGHPREMVSAPARYPLGQRLVSGAGRQSHLGRGPWHERYEVAAGHLILRSNGPDRMVFPIVAGDVLTGRIELHSQDEEEEPELFTAELVRDHGGMPVF